MRIKRIELRGFKSFADPTAFHFGPGIAAVVGPNGCGKSNLIDAIRWTLGEQSPGTLRGRAMSDVIFAGSDARPRANRADVALVFDNTDGAFGGRYRRYSEIEVSRQLDRSGTSGYAINRQRARLKDVTELFLDTGVGARAYSIIEQGRVGFVVNARPEERRVLIDEVAGINRFKTQKAETERRLEGTKANLLRVADRCDELGRQRKTLQAQVRRAERFLDLRRAWRSNTLRALLAEASSLRSAQIASDADVAALEEAAAQAGARLDEATKAAKALAEQMSEADARFEQHRDELASARSRHALLEQEITTRQEEVAALRKTRESADRALDEVASEIATARSALADTQAESERTRAALQASLADQAGREKEHAAAREAVAKASDAVEAAKAAQLDVLMRVSRQASAIKVLERQIADSEADLRAENRLLDDIDAGRRAAQELVAARAAALQAAVEGTVAAAGRLTAAQTRAERAHARAAEEEARARAAESAVHALRARVESTREVVASLAGFQPGVRALVDWIRDEGADSVAARGWRGVVADLLEVPPAVEADVEQVLGGLLAAGVFADEASLKHAAAWLAAQDLGGVSLLVPDRGEPIGLAQEVADERCPGLAARLLGGVARVEDVSGLPLTGAAVAGRGSAREGIVTVGTPTDLAAGQLARRRSLRRLEGELAEAVAVAEQVSTTAADLVEERERVAAQLRAAGTARHEAELAELAARRDAEEAGRDLAAVEQRTARGAERVQRLQRVREEARGRLETARTQRAAAEERSAAEQARLEAAKRNLAETDAVAARAGREVTATRVRGAEIRQAAAIAERELRRLRTALETAERREAREIARARDAAQRLELLAARLTALSSDREDTAGQVARLESSRADHQQARDRARISASAQAERLVALRTSGAEAERALNAARVGAAERRGGIAAAIERAAREFDLDVTQHVDALARGQTVKVTVPMGPDEPPLTLTLDPGSLADQRDALSAEAARLDRASRGLGAVNLGAHAEFAEIDARWQELSSQQADLESAVEDLHQALRTIAAETRSRFLQSFEAVARHFGVLYPRLVGGGRAELTLTDPAHPLASGVDVRVEPPGKRLQTLRLLSGGEKAMAAIALVFAIFEVKPSPFCLLDEVDAPLDEANSRRFNAMLRELSTRTQFVVITHNRTTMEVADVLYGVTMQEAGASSLVAVELDQLPA